MYIFFLTLSFNQIYDCFLFPSLWARLQMCYRKPGIVPELNYSFLFSVYSTVYQIQFYFLSLTDLARV